MKENTLALDLLDTDLADRVRTIKDDARLRRFACECAYLALVHSETSDPRSLKAVEVARLYANDQASDTELDEAYGRAEEAAEATDEEAFDMRDAFEEGRVPEKAYAEAFAAARAAFSARDCCARSARAAADNAAYEAWAALSTVVENGKELSDLELVDLSAASVDTAIVALFKDVLTRLK